MLVANTDGIDTQAMMPANTKAITFDAAGTLLEPWPSVGAVYARVAEECGIGPVSADALDRQFARAWKQKQDFDYSRDAWRRMVDQTFAGHAHTKPAFFDHVYDEFAQARCWRVYEDAAPVLNACRKRGLKLGVISNWDERLRPLLEQMGLAPYFDALVISAESGSRKPAPEIFQRAVELLQLSPGEILHVGDSLDEDVKGASAAGLQSVLLDRRGNDKAAIYELTALIVD
jgi:putative hydrolase of the HAD superfamily